MYLAQCTAPMCAPSADGSGGPRPFAFPPFARLLDGSECCYEKLSMLFLPVTHKKDAMGLHAPSLDAHFYYFAAGCSDTYVRAGTTLVARNRYHALQKLKLQQTPRLSLSQAVAWMRLELAWFQGGCNMTAAALIAKLVSFNACREYHDPLVQCLISTRIGMTSINIRLLELMEQLNVDTVVLAYEAPAQLHSFPRGWKTEIIRRAPFMKETFYTGDMKPCRIRETSSCVYCEKAKLSKASCVGPKLLLSSTPQRNRSTAMQARNVTRVPALLRHIAASRTRAKPRGETSEHGRRRGRGGHTTTRK
ncbi:hypothetical protein AB1Y20_004617 [Prymnesium parvum]|uniref:Uncharacterized protein n=1 Tax=Prymnesium parvum TaxID=97485 RepID=A0AB34IXK0_PRYPA